MIRDDLFKHRKAYRDWERKYEPLEFYDYDGVDGENMKKVQTIPNEYVWTAHATCDNEQVSAGFHFFGDPPSCCWSTFGWYVSKTASRNKTTDDFEAYNSSYYCECKCFNEETEEGNPDCELCEGEGWRTHYFDE